MISLALYLFVVLSGSAGMLGHAPLVPRLARWLAARRSRRAFRDSRDTGTPPKPAERRTAPRAPSWANAQPIKEN